MFGKAMNRYYYGKSGQGDYSKDDLPTNRWQLFWEMLRIRLNSLFRLNLIYMIIWLPAIVVIGRFLSMCISGLNVMGGFQAQLDAGEITAEAFAENGTMYLEAIKSLFFQTLLFLIPCIAITGPVTAGVTYVTRNWSRDEHAFMWSDMLDAIKANWKQALLTSVITGIMPTMVYVCNYYYGNMAQGNLLFMVPQVLCILIGLIWSLMLIYIYPLIITYDLKYKDILRNALLLSIARLPFSVLVRLATLVPAAIAAVCCMFFTQYTFVILLVLAAWYLLLGFTLSRFVTSSYTNAVFDKYINIKIEGAQVNRGLYTPDEDDEDYEDETPASMDE